MTDPSVAIRWPTEFAPAHSPIHVRNQLTLSVPPAAAWACLIRASDWPSWYSNSHEVRIHGGAADLSAGATFHWRTFGVNLKSRVEEFLPSERIAWTAKGVGVWAYHAWLIRLAPAGCSVLTEETQHGFVARLGRVLMPSRMHRFHQLWLEALEKKARAGLPQP
jgi:hypothetical protein